MTVTWPGDLTSICDEVDSDYLLLYITIGADNRNNWPDRHYSLRYDRDFDTYKCDMDDLVWRQTDDYSV